MVLKRDTLVNKMYLSAENAIVALISFYQKSISPHKGFCCAHRALHNGMSCSEWGKRAVVKAGVSRFFPLMFRRFEACCDAYETLCQMNESDKDQQDNDSEDSEINPIVNRESISCCISVMPCY